MSTSAPQTASVLDDYLDLFDALSELGVEFVVIGGYAVAAYARLLGESVFSQDLDLFVTRRTLEAVVGESAALGVTVEQLPSPREVPVAVLKWRGLEVNLLTASEGLPTPDVEARAAREFLIQGERELTILVADPFDLLRNKLAINRPKDRPHVTLLLSFLEAEVVHDFSEEKEPRARLGAAERLLEVRIRTYSTRHSRHGWFPWPELLQTFAFSRTAFPQELCSRNFCSTRPTTRRAPRSLASPRAGRSRCSGR